MVITFCPCRRGPGRLAGFWGRRGPLCKHMFYPALRIYVLISYRKHSMLCLFMLIRPVSLMQTYVYPDVKISTMIL